VYHTPWRLWVLLQYGEGPHISALSLLPFALAFAWLALEKRRLPALAAAALFCALVALTNFYGATGLAIFYVALVWAAWVTWRDKRIWLRAAAIPALAYGLSAFWLTPSYLRLTIANLRLVSGAGRQWSAIALVALALLLILAAVRFRGYALFLTGSLLLFGFNVLGYVYFQRYITGDPWRLIPELDFAVILGCVEILRRLWRWAGKAQWHTRAARVLVMVAILGSLWSARHYVKRAWGDYLYPPTDYTQRVEYRLSEWMAGHFPQERSFVTGSTRLWWDTWRDLAQVEGGSDQGQLNPYLPDAEWNLTREANPETAVQWLLALGAGAAIVPFEKSQDAYHDFRFPHKFEGRLPMLYGDGQGNVIYRVPRRFPSLARVVDRDRLAGLPSLPLRTTSLDALHTYTALIEEGPDSPASMTWDGPDRLLVHAHMERGQSVLVQESYDPAWHAYLGRQAVPIYRDPIAFMRIDLPPGDQDLRLIFEMPFENRIGWSITFLSLVILAVLAAYGRQKAPSG
jgi:hypothetical protein